MRRVSAALLALGVLCAAGCNQSTPTMQAVLNPSAGHVPFEARIACYAPPGELTFELPEETIGPQESGEIHVTVDSLDWSARVVWTDGEHVLECILTATAANARPRIRRVRINGKDNEWQLEPFARTLIEVIVDYRGEWELESIEVEGSNDRLPYTVFHPPYTGEPHAYWQGWVIENAGIVYPVYASIETDGLPFTPTGLDEGYPTSYQVTNALFYDYSASREGLEIPEQTGTITVAVRDEFGRRTTRAFDIPIQAADFTEG